METKLIKVTNLSPFNRQVGNYFLPSKQQVVVPLDFISMAGIDRDLVIDLMPIQSELVTRENDNLAIDWWSPLSAVDGYGRHAIDIIRGLKRVGVDVSVRDVGWVDNLYLPDDIRAWRAESFYRMPRKIGIAFTLGYDPQLFKHPSPLKIALTQFETTHVPRMHVENINHCDHLIVTSHYQVDVMRSSGVTIPIDVMTAGIDTDYFAYKSWLDRKKDGKFKVLLTGALTDRKNPLAAIRIFQRASEGNPDWSLTLKSRNAEGINKVAAESKKDRRIKLFISDSHPQQILQLYHSHDVLLWPSKGEGVGLPPLEAMATGMEVVCSANSGMLDYVDSSRCWPIRTAGMESAAGVGKFSSSYVSVYGDVGDWWLPSEDHAVEQLKACFNAWYGNKGKGKAGAEYVRKHRTLLHQARSIKAVAERYM